VLRRTIAFEEWNDDLPKVVDWDEEFSIFVSYLFIEITPELNPFYASYF
jgi:hypothetical protein